MEIDAHLEGDHDPTELEAIPDRGNALRIDTLTQPVSSFMRPKTGTVAPNATVYEAVQLMARGHYGCVLVLDGPRLVGILSERDVVVRLVERDKDPKTEKVKDHMTMEPESVRPDEALIYALNIMTVGGFRHVPVTDLDGALAGIISIRDVTKLLVNHFREEILTVAPSSPAGPKTQHGG